jgi:hypothetical protein
MSERQITREEAIERVELHLRGLWSKTTQEEAEEIVEAIGAWDQEDEIASNEWEWTDLKKTISREDLWKLAGPNRWYGQGQRHDIARWEEDRDLVEATARALGYEVAEEDEPPKLPRGWNVEQFGGTPGNERCRLTLPGRDDGGIVYLYVHGVEDDVLRSILARALDSLHRDDGEVELMVPVSEIKHRGSEWDISPHQKMLMGQSAVRARRVRP